jgi:hypothetical protein
MMDHVTRQSKHDDKQRGIDPVRDVNQREEKPQASYYYDDSSNYEVYRDDDSEADDSPENDQSAG